jgi:hypothetical protein
MAQLAEHQGARSRRPCFLAAESPRSASRTRCRGRHAQALTPFAIDVYCCVFRMWRTGRLHVNNLQSGQIFEAMGFCCAVELSVCGEILR